MEAKQGVEIPVQGQGSGGTADPSRSDDPDHDDLELGTSGPMRSRKRTKHGRYISDITLAELQQFTHLPAHVACEKLGLGLTSFKRVCRSLGIQTWPYRKEPLGMGGGRSDGSEEWRTRGGVQRTGGIRNQNGTAPLPGLGAGPSTSASPTGVAAFAAAIHGLAGLHQAPDSGPPGPNLAAAASLFGGAPAANASDEGLVQRLFRQATPATLVALLDKARSFSAEMKAALGVTIIDDAAVDLLHYVAVRLRDSAAPVHAPPPTWGSVAPPPPLPLQPSASVPALGPEPMDNGGGDGGAHQHDAMQILTALAAAYSGGQGGIGGGGAGGSRTGVPPPQSHMGHQ